MGRTVEVPEYRLRAGDELEVLYRLTGVESAAPYELNVGDRIRIESMTDPAIERELLVQPDGMITVRMLGQVRAARRTLTELRDDLEAQYLKYYKSPAISVIPLQVNAKLEELRAAIKSGTGDGAQVQIVRITPEGTIQLPAIGSAPAQGLTLDELKLELDERYAVVVDGVGVTPRLTRRAPRFVFVAGAVRQPGRYALEAPTSLMQGLTLAGGWTKECNLRQVIVLRRTEDWRIMATGVDLRSAARGTAPCIANDIWLRDGDLVVVPENHWFSTTDLFESLSARHLRNLPPARARAFSVQQMSAL
jgi:polysaccharide export outer membrane protein